MMEVDLTTIVQAFRPIIPTEAALAVADGQQFVYYEPGANIDLAIQPGEKLRLGTAALKAIKEQRVYTSNIDKGVFGQAYFATAYPIPLQNGGVGAITIILPPTQRSSLQTQRPSLLIGKQEDRWLPLHYSQIIFIKSQNGKTYLHTTRGIFQNKYTLTELELLLPSHLFIRVHRAYLIRMEAIQEIQPHFHSTFMLIMQDQAKSKIPVSQKYSSYFRQLLGF